MRATIVSVLLICLLGAGFFVYWNKAGHHTKSDQVTKVSRIKGKIKWFNEAKGYGFIAQEDGTDVFVYHTAIQPDGFKSLRVGDEVEFEIIDGPKGREARNVVKVQMPNQ